MPIAALRPAKLAKQPVDLLTLLGRVLLPPLDPRLELGHAGPEFTDLLLHARERCCCTLRGGVVGDLRYAVEGTTLRFPQIDFGLVPDAGATVGLHLLIGPARAKEIILSGEPVSAQEAANLGLVNRVFPQEEFSREVMEIARKMAKKPPLALGIGKQLINRGIPKRDTRAGLDEVTDAQSFLITTEDYREGVNAFLDKREPVFRGR